MLNDNAKKILNDKVKLQDYLDNHPEHGFAYYIDFNDYTKDVYKHNEKHGKLYSIFTVDIDENILTIGIRKELTKDYKYATKSPHHDKMINKHKENENV